MGWFRLSWEIPATCALPIGRCSGFVSTSSTRETMSAEKQHISGRFQTRWRQMSRCLPVRYEVNCFGPQRIGKRVVVFTVFWYGCDLSFGKKCVPSDDSPHHRSLTNVADGGLCTVHFIWLTVTRRKHLSWPSTRGGRLVEGTTSLWAGETYFPF